ncbi:fungal-specific transcription factor domain-containing protein [Exophiala viscosa]|uniref:fungal-specific transcription factor domain-containing protein n=1 Tax=Exophiala viscosa TaxID=2486360 RepID=UPI00219276F1|nr:fungal-specific transcription factor domain-containing protein [Exophiala viscosa]
MRSEPVQRRQRASRACDFCHARGLRCLQAQESRADCVTCTNYGVKCTMNRPIRRRGRKPTVPGSDELDDGQPKDEDPGSAEQPSSFPFLSESDLLGRWETGVPDQDGASYLLLMAVCAVSCQAAALNAVFDDALLEGLCVPESDQYFSEAVSKVPARIGQSESQDLDYLRSFGLLAVYSLQCGNHSDLHRYLGLYHALVAQTGLHDESRWPELPMTEVDDRRRLFWCVYRLEIHSACVLGHVVRLPESQVSVLYPRKTTSMDAETQAWTLGWDYITDLFRLLEYAISSLRGKNRKPGLVVFHDGPSPTTLLGSLARLKAGKSRTLLYWTEPGNQSQSNRCRYMTVQINCTEALVSIMTLLCCQAPVREVVDIAESFLDQVTKAPLIMFKVASSQIVHQLLGVGHMLLNASRYDDGQLRSEAKRLVEVLADLVKNLEHDIPAAAEAGERLLRLADAAR